MNHFFIINSTLTSYEIESAITERIVHIQAIINCLYATTDACICLEKSTIYDVIHVLYEQSEEIELLRKKQLEN